MRKITKISRVQNSILIMISLVQDCARCAGDINQAVQDCQDIPADDDHALYVCIEDALIAAADCIECICEVLGTLMDIDIEPCRGAK